MRSKDRTERDTRESAGLVGVLQRVMSGLLTVLIAVVLIDPSDKILHAKVLVFSLIFALWIAVKIGSDLTLHGFKLSLLAFLIAIIVPLTSLTIGLIQGNIEDPISGLTFLKAYLFFSILIVVMDQRIVLDRFAVLTWGIVIITFVVFAIAIFSPIAFASVYQYSLDKRNLMISERSLGFGMFYYKTSSSMIFALALSLRWCRDGKRLWIKLILVLSCGFALVLSGTRANIAGAFAVILFYAYRWIRKKVGRVCGFGFVALLSVASLVYVANHWFTGMGNEDSDKIKGRHLLAYADLLCQHPEALIVGEGIGSRFFSSGVFFYSGDGNGRMYDSELTYLELIRELGLPLALIVIAAFLGPVYLIYRHGLYSARRHLVIAYLTYLGIAGSNPLLISSTGMIIVVCMYSAALPYSTSKTSSLLMQSPQRCH